MIVIATDLPLSSRQLKRVSQRASAALGRTGSYIGHGSGDIALAFQTAHRLAHHSDQDFETGDFLREDRLDTIFEATVEAVEEAIISSLYHAEGMTGLHRRVLGLRQVLEDTAPAAASYQEGE